MSTPVWPTHAAPPPLRADDVHVWAVDRDADAGDNGMLSPPERARREAFRFARDRLRYATSHAALYRLLGAYLGCAPEAVRLITGQWGKPALDPRTHSNPVWFNMAASGPLALIAVTRAAEVGVDLEELAPFPDLSEVAADHFSPEERAAIAAATGAQRLATFYRCWTRKEAYLKALGVGLRQPLHRFAVSADSRSTASLIHVDSDPAEGAQWSIIHLEPRVAFVGAVACRARTVRVGTFAAAAPTAVR